jgi:tetratricopeptide (TPR) repeat protein
LIERALGIDEKAFGPEHPIVALRLANLAAVLQVLGEPMKAMRLLLRAQAIAEKRLPANHPWRARICNNLARYTTLTLAPASQSAPFQPTPGPAAGLLQDALSLSSTRTAKSEPYVLALRNAMESGQREGDAGNAARAALLLGAHQGQIGGWEEAQRVLQQGLRLAQQSNNPSLVAEAHRLLGDAFLQGSLYEQARLSYEDAIRRFEAIGEDRRALDTRLLLLPLLVQFGKLASIPRHLDALRKALAGLDGDLRSEVSEVVELAEKALQTSAGGSSENE